ncbi:MAG: RNA polymerase sigma factor SigJ [Solirubrobacteraceae bacterium]|nr:RNA polymerase sigma factor SigJ [Solirubrobacteraceae bacterium]
MPVSPTCDRDYASPRRAAFAIGYRMLGSVDDAEDIAQETVSRLARETEPPTNADAWATTVATRLSIDTLRSARVRRETYVGTWLPEPLLADPSPGPADRAELADSLSQALLIALERLSPVERAAFLLREAFDYDYAQIAPIIDRTEANARQLVARAKKHVGAGKPRFDPDDAARDRLFAEFLAAVDGGDLDGLERLLADDVTLWGDGGGKVMSARRPVHGLADVARFLVHTTRWTASHLAPGGLDAQVAQLNGQPGQILREPTGEVFMALSVDVVDGKIAAIRIVRNPEKLRHLAAHTA